MTRPAKHRKPRHAPARATTARHRKAAPQPRAPGRRPARIVLVTAALVLGAAGSSSALMRWSGSWQLTSGAGQPAALAPPGSGRGQPLPSPSASRSHASGPGHETGRASVHRAARHKPARRTASPAASPRPSRTHATVTISYRNPLRDVSNLLPERIDMGVDFGGSGPVYALGDAIITSATAASAGWPGGGWITYQLTSGPAAGLTVYLAEDVTPTVTVGQRVTSGAQIATMFDGGDGIEFGWAMPDSSSAESQLSEAGAISGGGPFPTSVGLNFEELLQALGVPAAPNREDSPFGTRPAKYPADWAAALPRH